MNIAGNWYFIAVMTFVFLPVIWFVTDRIVEPRLGGWTGGAVAGGDASEDDDPSAPLTEGQKKGLWRALQAWRCLAVCARLAGPDRRPAGLDHAGRTVDLWRDVPLFNEAALSTRKRIAVALVPFFQSWWRAS
jgi:aminobenzoyl-glutamate transport protein